jgi:hypothetical protein
MMIIDVNINMLIKHYGSTRITVLDKVLKRNPPPQNKWIVSKTTKTLPTYALILNICYWAV